MMINESIWASLEGTSPTGAGWAKTRILQNTGQDLWLGVKQPQLYRALIYIVPAKDAPPLRQLPDLLHISIDLLPHGEDQVEICVRLEDSSLDNVFTVLVNDIAGHVGGADSTKAGAEILIARLRHWRSLLQPDSANGLSREKRRGLAGELLTLRRLLEAGGDPSTVVGSWVGPAGGHQDFQTTLAALEVKTSSGKQPQTLRISSERQLDLTGIDHLFLAHVSLDERSAGSGESLPFIVADLESRVPAELMMDFRQMLYLAGLVPPAMPFLEEPVYSLRSMDFFEVRGDFPRIVESMCSDGVGDVSYAIQLGSIQGYQVEESAVFELFGANS